MCTSTAVKPARMKTAAISYWLLTPCSRNTATFGPATPRYGRAMLSLTSKDNRALSPGSLSSAMRSNSSFAVAGLSRNDWMRQLIWDHSRCSRFRSSSRTTFSSFRTISVCLTSTRPIAVAFAPVRSNTICTCVSLFLATWTTAPASSENNCDSNCCLEPLSFSDTPRRLANIISATVATNPPSLRSWYASSMPRSLSSWMAAKKLFRSFALSMSGVSPPARLKACARQEPPIRF